MMRIHIRHAPTGSVMKTINNDKHVALPQWENRILIDGILYKVTEVIWESDLLSVTIFVATLNE